MALHASHAGEKVEICDGIACKSIECKPPFVWKKAEEMSTCCPLCWADDVGTPSDRSFGAGGVAAGECEGCRGFVWRWTLSVKM